MSLSGDTALFIPMAKIWTVEGSSYDDYGVEGVFSSEEKAKAYRDKWNADEKTKLMPWAVKVVERELDPEYPA